MKERPGGHETEAPGRASWDAVLGGLWKPRKNREKCGLQSGKKRPPEREGYMPGRPHPGGPALLERNVAGPFFPFQAFSGLPYTGTPYTGPPPY